MLVQRRVPSIASRFVLALVLLPLACDKKPDAPPDRPPPQVDPPTVPEPVADDGTPPPPDPTAGRTALVPESHPQFGRIEGDGFPNGCKEDGDCSIGGCSSEVCSAEQGVITTCEAIQIPGWPEDAECGCVSNKCAWWSASGATLPGGDPPKGHACGDAVCKAPHKCVEYYGIAGPSGPKFESCEIVCTPGKTTCPEGTECVTIADGPGNVCR